MYLATYVEGAALVLDFEPSDDDHWRSFEEWIANGRQESEGEFAWLVFAEIDRVWAPTLSDQLQGLIDDSVGSNFDVHSSTDRIGRCTLVFHMDCGNLGWDTFSDEALRAAERHCRDACKEFPHAAAKFFNA
jgi:hypothetical protein